MNSLQFRLATAIISALSCFILGWLAYQKNKESPLHRYFAFFNLSLGVWNISDLAMALAPQQHVLLIDRISYAWATLMVPSFVYLSCEFAKRPFITKIKKWAIWIPCIFLLLITFTPLIIQDVKTKPHLVETPGPLYIVFALYLLWWVGFGVVQVYLGYRVTSGSVKNQLRYVFLGFFFGFLAAADYIACIAFPSLPVLYYLLVTVYNSIIFMAIVKYRLMDINLVFRYAMIYFLFALTLALPFSIVPMLVHSPVISFISVFMALFFAPAIEKKIIGVFRKFVDKLPPFRGKYDFLTNVPGLKKLVSKSSSVQLWAKNLADSFNQLIQIENVVVFVFDEANQKYLATASSGVPIERYLYSSPSESDVLVRQLKVSRNLVQREYVDHEVPSEYREALKTSLGLMNSALCVPFFNGDYLVGFASIGKKLARGFSQFHPDHFNGKMMADELDIPSIVSRGKIYLNRLISQQLKADKVEDLKLMTSSQLSNAFNSLVRQPDWLPKVPGLSSLELRAEGLSLLSRFEEKKESLTPEELRVLAASVLEGFYRGELINVFSEETFNDEDLKAIEGLMHGATDALTVIFMTMAGQMKSAEWAHDLRHPFSKGSFNLLTPMMAGEMGPITKEQYNALAIIQSDAKFVESRITDLVSPENAHTVNFKHVDLIGFLREVFSRFSYFAKLSGVNFRLVIPESPVWVRCDPDQIQYRVLNNLIDNAIRHTPAKGTVDLGARINGNKAYCFVRNVGGEPIPPSMLPHLFERGSKEKRPTTSSKRGLAGLGLYNVAETLKRHESKITVESSKEAGTFFEFDLLLE